MKSLLITLLVFCYFSLCAQIIEIPDANFKQALIKERVDLNKDGEIQLSEATTITKLDISYNKIDSLTGIEYFNNLIDFNCGFNNLRKLNLNKLPKLLKLNCRDNNLIELDIKECKNIIFLDCRSNKLVDIDLQNLRKVQNWNVVIMNL